ncbi:MAG: oxidoreductase [Stenotrophobium sp.]
MKTKWAKSDISNLDGKIAIVTGANSGLGYETALGLASAGAQVILACRDRAKTEAAMNQIRKEAPQANLEFMQLDLGDLASVRAFAQKFSAGHPKLDLLCNNAGLMALPLRRTKDGFEMQIGTNHLGHFALTGLLLPKLQSTPGARVATMSSGFHKPGKIRFDDLNWNKCYSKWPAYFQSKLANLLFMFELQRRFEKHGINAISVGAHPGYAATNLQKAGPEMENSGFGKALMHFANTYIAQPAPRGALPMLCAATSAEVNGGDYIGPDGFAEQSGYPKKVGCSARARDTQAAKKLWTLSEELTGVAYLN